MPGCVEVRVLLIDDDPDDRRLAARVLGQDLGSPEIVEIGTDAELEAELQGSAEPVLVVSDYLLGWTDAFDVLQRVRSVYPECPVIVFTGMGDDDLAARFITAGANGYVDKRDLKRLGEAARQAMRNGAKMTARFA